MASPLSGFEKWVSGVKSRMENDPGRQDLEDHILCNGFLFLQEYLEDILNGTRSEPIIELTKTPGRRKEMSKKDRMESATKTKRTFESPEKENIDIFTRKPILSFQKPQNFQSSADVQEERAVEILVTPPSNSNKKPDANISPNNTRTVKFFLEPDPVENNQGGTLSMIAEGDEPETSQPVISPRKGLIIGEREISYQIPNDPNDPDGPMATITVPYSEEDRSFDDSEPTSTIGSFPIDPYARDYETHELPKIIPADSPPRVEDTQPIQIPAPNLTRQANLPVFPNLPPLSPMRKSTRESVSTSNGAIVKQSTTNGTRTSWLQKAKDVTAKHGGVKRKSGEMSEDYSESVDSLNRMPKIARTEDNSLESSADKVQPKPIIQPFRPIAKPRDPQVHYTHLLTASNENTDGMMDVLKRTVEGLGARVGKGVGKSLGGAAASAAAAEAKAAAEARLAQREAKGSDGVRNSRPSVSELNAVYETGSAKDGDDSRDSMSKHTIAASPVAPRLILDRTSIASTPPDSPPMSQIRVVHQINIPQFQVQRPLLKDLGVQSQSQSHSQPSTQSTYVSNLFDDNPTWTQSSFATEHTATQTFSQSQSQGLTQAHAEYQDNALNFQSVRWSQDAEKNEEPLNHELDTQDEYHEIVDEKEMVSGQDAVPHVVAAQYRNFEDFQTDDTVSQSSPEKPQGFVAHASNMLSKVMGSATLKRTKPEPVKSIQLAAVAAKKQQEEAEKKTARLKEMEKRRAVIASKKAEQDTTEKSKLQKREREDDPTKIIVKKTDDDTTKKRKVTAETEKKAISIKKPPSKDKGNSTTANAGVGRTLPKPTPSSQHPVAPPSLIKSTKQTGPVSNSGPSSQSNMKLNPGQSQLDLKTPLSAQASKLRASQSKTNLKEAVYEDIRQPSETLHARMQARVQAQITQIKQQEPVIPSESIELPDINSEYSNSDDEDRPRTFDPPDWAQSPVLAQALQSQSRLNPDDIFGPVKPLRMEEIFKKNTSRFRARTSSANWAGTDELTKEEEKAYAKRMGYVDL